VKASNLTSPTYCLALTIYIPDKESVELSADVSTFREDGSSATCYVGNSLLQTAESFRVLDKENFLSETAERTNLISVRVIRPAGGVGVFTSCAVDVLQICITLG
jgi:hypothetical protein